MTPSTLPLRKVQNERRIHLLYFASLTVTKDDPELEKPVNMQLNEHLS
jgi:hypothetical protein